MKTEIRPEKYSIDTKEKKDAIYAEYGKRERKLSHQRPERPPHMGTGFKWFICIIVALISWFLDLVCLTFLEIAPSLITNPFTVAFICPIITALMLNRLETHRWHSFNQAEKDYNLRIESLRKERDAELQKIKEEASRKCQEYEQEFNKNAQSLSKQFAQNRTTQEISEWITMQLCEKIKDDEWRSHGSKTDGFFKLKVYKNKINCPNGSTYDFSLKGMKNLATDLENRALSFAIEQAVLMRIRNMSKYSINYDINTRFGFSSELNTHIEYDTVTFNYKQKSTHTVLKSWV